MGCRSDEGRREDLNKEFERCCTFLAEMMEKYGALVLRDIAVEILIFMEVYNLYWVMLDQLDGKCIA